ncbi:MAG: acetylglutamate kinase [Acidobacteriota bacterium]|nr:acetylglutamate kinase [Acidobacteriota bacterium]
MKALIKIGGALLDSPELRDGLARDITAAAAAGIQIAVVHGGGKRMTRYLAERGVESRFVDGLRVTTPEVLDAVVKVLAGSVNQELVAAFVAAGSRAVGLTGLDGLLAEAEPIGVGMGATGRPFRSNPDLLELLTADGYLPVVACLGGDRQGRIFNVNADQMAAACAAGWRVDRLVFLTDVAGVLDGSGVLLPRLSAAECVSLKRSQIATGGMLAKLDAALEALRQGVPEVAIAAGAEPGIVARLLAGEAAGTRLISEPSEVVRHG